jgi:hypothetical protein
MGTTQRANISLRPVRGALTARDTFGPKTGYIGACGATAVSSRILGCEIAWRLTA